MFDQFEFSCEFFETQEAVDLAILKRVAAAGCRLCGGRLDRGDYPRKPRGGAIGAAAEGPTRRFSLCCREEGCRKRSTPPSVRFLGRRVYVGAVVLVASVIALVSMKAAEAGRRTGIVPRTLRRWGAWWQGSFTKTAAFVEIASRLVPAPARSRFPASILERLSGTPSARVETVLMQLAPITSSMPDGSRFVRAIV